MQNTIDALTQSEGINHCAVLSKNLLWLLLTNDVLDRVAQKAALDRLCADFFYPSNRRYPRSNEWCLERG